MLQLLEKLCKLMQNRIQNGIQDGMLQFWCENQAPDAPKRHRDAPGRSKTPHNLPPYVAKTAAKPPQDSPKTAPRNPNMRPRRPQELPKAPQDARRGLQDMLSPPPDIDFERFWRRVCLNQKLRFERFWNALWSVCVRNRAAASAVRPRKSARPPW